MIDNRIPWWEPFYYDDDDLANIHRQEALDCGDTPQDDETEGSSE